MIQVSDYFRKFRGHKEITEQVEKNAAILIAKVSMLLSLIPYETKITSGFRTQAYNKQIGGSASSSHCFGQGIDLWDPDCVIGLWCVNNLEYLKEHGLFMESLTVTHKSEDRAGRWTHLQTRPTKSGNIVFLP